MIKNIKRVGIIFLAVAIICLMTIGCLVSANVIVLGGANKDILANFNNKNSVSEKILDESQYDYKLEGTNTQMSDTWTAAVNHSLANKVNVKVLLKKNWVASEDATFGTSFGPNSGAFLDGSILIANGAKITFNLNGYTIDMKREVSRLHGVVFNVGDGGELTIEDTSYNESDLIELYNACINVNLDYAITRLKAFKIGKITGGIGGISGAMYITSAKLHFNGGMVVDNLGVPYGGTLSADNGNIEINGGIFLNNSALNNGGAFNINNTTLTMNGGIVLGNNAVGYGGAVNANNSTLYIKGGYITGNKVGESHGKGGGVYASNGSVVNMSGGVIDSNFCYFDGGGIIIFTGEESSKQTQLVMTGGIVKNNYAANGAGVYISGQSIGSIDGGEIIGNVASNVGAGLFVYSSSTCVVDDVKVANNKVSCIQATTIGGAGVVVGSGSTLTFNNGLVTNNEISFGDYSGAGVSIYRTKESVLPSTLTINGGTITENYANGGVASGVYLGEFDDTFNLGGATKIFDNYAGNKVADIYLDNNRKINITDKLIKNGTPQIGVTLADDYGTSVFTNNFVVSGNSDVVGFYCNSGAKIATLRDSEIAFENTISSSVYDFIYLENGKRKDYKSNGYKHLENDYDLRQNVNNGKLILGNITERTSVNAFINNIDYDGTIIKLIDAQGNVVFGNGANSKYADFLGNGLELAVGTGWVLETYNASGTKIETFYVSVLGDLTGDGKVNSADVNYIRKIVNNNQLFVNALESVKISSLIVNNGKLPTNADAEILWNVVCGKIAIDDFI